MKYILWCEDGEVYRASYYRHLERIIVREAESNTVVLIYDNVTPFEWGIFKLRILKWKERVPDVEEN